MYATSTHSVYECNINHTLLVFQMHLKSSKKKVIQKSMDIFFYSDAPFQNHYLFSKMYLGIGQQKRIVAFYLNQDAKYVKKRTPHQDVIPLIFVVALLSGQNIIMENQLTKHLLILHCATPMSHPLEKVTKKNVCQLLMPYHVLKIMISQLL